MDSTPATDEIRDAFFKPARNRLFDRQNFMTQQFSYADLAIIGVLNDIAQRRCIQDQRF